jgi:hypothetical protein
MKVWIKLTKYFQGGMKTDYMLVDEKEIKTKSQQKEVMENWGENSDGGHAYGYRVEMSVLEKDEIPPTEWIKKAVKRITDAIECLTLKTVRTKEELKALENLLK